MKQIFLAVIITIFLAILVHFCIAKTVTIVILDEFISSASLKVTSENVKVETPFIGTEVILNITASTENIEVLMKGN